MADTAPRQVQPRVDETSADLGTLINLGLVDEQPAPQYQNLFLEPDLPPADEPE